MIRLRGSAILLLLALLGGGIGLPLFDALVFHSNPGGRARAERTLGEEGSAPAHIQVCQLNHAVPAERSLGGRAIQAPAAPGIESAPHLSFPPAEMPAPATPLPFSRAPPSA